MLKGSPLRRYRPSRISRSMILLVVLMFASIPNALAHRVILFAYAEGDRVFTESYFSDGKQCQDSRIEVFDSYGNKLLEGKTDRNGQFSFSPPKKTDLRIVLTASMGHRDEYLIPAKEVQGGSEGSAERRNEGVSFVGLMGGIGFIFGIMGIILYFKSRRGR